jgi:vancomycin resistance protein YoaR
VPPEAVPVVAPTAPTPPPAPPLGRGRGGALLLGSGVALLVTIALGAAVAVAVAPAGRVLPNVTVAGVAIGRLDAAAARELVATTLEGPVTQDVPSELALTTPDGVVLVPTAGLGVRVDPDATVRRALGLGRTGTPTDLATRLRSLRAVTEVAPVLAADAAAVRAVVDAVADDLDRPADPGGVLIDRERLEVSVAAPRRGVEVRRADAAAAIAAALAAGDRGAIGIPADVTPVPVRPEVAEVLATRIRAALSSGLVLVADGTAVRVEPTELAAAMTVVTGVDAEGRPTPVLRLDRWTVARTVGARLVAAFDRDVIDASLTVPAPRRFTAMGSAGFRPVAVEVVLDPGRTARRFRMDRTARQLEDMIVTGRRSATADLEEAPPTVTADELRRHPLPTHLLGTFTTFHPAGADRTVNIRRLADTVDGTLVAPGGELSVNEASGERRCEDGYLPAGTIVRGELVDTCGGGVSQFGTTAYNAAFFAGLPTVEWQPHSFHIGRYPMGREATLSFPVLDVRAVNDTDGWLLVRTSHTPTSVTVALYGVPRWDEVRAVHGEPRDPTPFPTELRPAPDLAPGQERVLQPGGDGFTIEVARELVPRGGGAPVVERTTTVYRPQTRIVEVGVTTGVDGGDTTGAPVGGASGAAG